MRHIPALDGVRGIAILLVLLFHSLLVQEDAPPAAPLHAVAASGWMGVDLFFVLSGFLITGILLDTPPGRRGLGRFYARRALRILPLYYAALLVFFYVLPRDRFPTLAWHDERELLYWTFVQNWAIAARGSWPDVPNLNHLWSLNIEEQFYLVWPLLVFGLGQRRLPWLCAALVLACPVLRILLLLQDTPWVAIYVTTIPRMDGLAMGGWIACLARGPRGLAPLVPAARVVAGACLATFVAVMLARGAVFLWDDWSVTVGFSFAAAGFGGALILAVQAREGGLWSRALSSRPLRAAGRYSYAVYVLHLPIIVLMQGGARVELPGSVPYLVHLTIVLVLSFAAALASWHLIERPFLRLKRRFADRPAAQEGSAAPA